ncbi:putative Diguanylate kinase [Richelia sinica FACHB-800]|uniref:Diguanylate kinase n=1 Tax=Richelia sinica FACHB-800 TaxID=1357546 RepID=A0A975T5R3_9NOST|nr:diguanylate cyclase [Richelia sinica]QXE22698.1 putative Diguanylate kinase [Richelia sinica FACHB-800]
MTPSNKIHNPLVLIVDDDQVIQAQLRHAMEKEGYRVIVAHNGLEALDFYNLYKPDIVLLDAIMPVLDGFSCCAQLQALNSNNCSDIFSEQVPVLMITGLDDPHSVDQAFAVGAADYITKPIHWAVLKQRVRRLLKMHWVMKELQCKIQQEQLIANITQKIRQSLNLEVILNTTVTEVKQLLGSDRVIVYQFQAEGHGIVLVESVATPWQSLLGKTIAQSYFVQKSSHGWKKGSIDVLEDIYTSELSPLQIELMIELQAQARLVVPILEGNNVWGLLVADQCSAPRQWQQLEIDLLKQIADQLEIALQQAQLYKQLEVANQELKRLATIDALTQIPNRRYFDEILEQEWKRLLREQAPLSLVLCDIDYFKKYNDTYGHQAGDKCLQFVASVLSESLKRPADVVARYGGEEFSLILPNTDTTGAVHIAQSIRLAMKVHGQTHISSEISQYLTLSFGVATITPSNNISPQVLIAKADQALYQAKQAGRDRIFIYSDIGQLSGCE